jgi:cell shape-determining protein MreC
MDWISANLPVLTFLLTALGGYFLWVTNTAGAKKSLSGAVKDMVESFKVLSDEFEAFKLESKKEIKILHAEMASLREENKTLKKQNDALRNRVRELEK